MSLMKLVYPGQDLGLIEQRKAGRGTIIHKEHIRSALLGTLRIESADGQSVVSIDSIKTGAEDFADLSSPTQVNLLPKVGDIVLARINRTSKLQANAQIIVIGDTPLNEDFQGIIRTTDVRAYDVDKVKIAQSFRPGDIVRAEVISLGDQSSYYLSTARNELGVLFAWSALGEILSPISWNQMATEGGSTEERKVAKPFL